MEFKAGGDGRAVRHDGAAPAMRQSLGQFAMGGAPVDDDDRIIMDQPGRCLRQPPLLRFMHVAAHRNGLVGLRCGNGTTMHADQFALGGKVAQIAAQRILGHPKFLCKRGDGQLSVACQTFKQQGFSGCGEHG